MLRLLEAAMENGGPSKWPGTKEEMFDDKKSLHGAGMVTNLQNHALSIVGKTIRDHQVLRANALNKVSRQ